jgi:hypothetical protein
MPSRPSTRTQLSLNLEARPPLPALLVPQEAVPALADLLLAAIGRTPQAGGSDEQQDQR